MINKIIIHIQAIWNSSVEAAFYKIMQYTFPTRSKLVIIVLPINSIIRHRYSLGPNTISSCVLLYIPYPVFLSLLSILVISFISIPIELFLINTRRICLAISNGRSRGEEMVQAKEADIRPASCWKWTYQSILRAKSY